MNTVEGLHRIAKALRAIGVIWFFGFAIFTEAAGLGLPFWHRMAVTLIGAAVPLSIAYGAAWIIDGFAKPKPAARPNAQ